MLTLHIETKDAKDPKASKAPKKKKLTEEEQK
jgi:hypothetical protein